MKKIYLILLVFFSVLRASAQEVFIQNVSKSISLKLNLISSAPMLPGVNQPSYSWNALEYERVVMESVEEALKNPEAIYSLLDIQVGQTSSVLSDAGQLLSRKGEQLKHLTVYPESFDSNDFIKKKLRNPVKMKAIRLNVVRSMQQVHETFIMKTLIHTSSASAPEVIEAAKYLKPRIKAYEKLYALIDDLPAEKIGTSEFLRVFNETFDVRLHFGRNSAGRYIIKSFIGSTVDDVLEAIARICRFL